MRRCSFMGLAVFFCKGAPFLYNMADFKQPDFQWCCLVGLSGTACILLWSWIDYLLNRMIKGQPFSLSPSKKKKTLRQLIHPKSWTHRGLTDLMSTPSVALFGKELYKVMVILIFLNNMLYFCSILYFFSEKTATNSFRCGFCGHFLWGFVSQGVKCLDCGFKAHKQCSYKVPSDCSPDLKNLQSNASTSFVLHVECFQLYDNTLDISALIIPSWHHMLP